jgi:outer membrane lipase/esterase
VKDRLGYFEFRTASPTCSTESNRVKYWKITAHWRRLLAGLESALLIKVLRLDLFELSQEVVAAPAAFGLTNVMDSCITPDTLIGAFCSQPDRYLFWDGNHPTAAAQGIVASRALSVLAGP